MIKKSIQTILGEGLSPEEVVIKANDLLQNGQPLDAMIVILYGQSRHSDHPLIKEIARDYQCNMVRNMIYDSVRKRLGHHIQKVAYEHNSN